MNIFQKKSLNKINLCHTLTLLSLFTFFLFSSSPLHASSEGILFFEVSVDEKRITADLSKLSEKKILSENIFEAKLHIYSNSKHKEIDILPLISEEIFEYEISEEFCFEECLANQYPYVKIVYAFNLPPEIELKSPVSGHMTNEEKILFAWEGKDIDGKLLEYMLEISENEKFSSTIFKTEWITKQEYSVNLKPGKYYWRVTVQDNSKLENVVVSNPLFFEIAEAEKESPPVNEEVLGIGGGGKEPEPIFVPRTSYCKYKYNMTYGKIQRRRCTFSKPILISVTHTTPDFKNFEKQIIGIYNPYVNIVVDVYRCRSRIVCREEYLGKASKQMMPYSLPMMYVNGTFHRMRGYKREANHKFRTRLLSNKNFANSNISARNYFNFSIKIGNAWDTITRYSEESNTLKIPKAIKISKETKPFRFPFAKNIGVTQWHGYTAFQSPHTGVDFGSYREPIYAIANGYVRTVNWDNYSGRCLSGGYFMRIEHDNGMHSVYLHLENFKKSNGHNWTVGERIRKGELLGLSGNTGAFNCQPLGYHLHFEVRQNQYQASHTNPVPLININWNNIPTLGYKQYPGRLSGDNPHPGW